MPRKSRNARIDNRSNRLKLPVARKPYEFSTVTPGVSVGYRRNQGPGSWVMRIADGQGGASIESIAVADDHENADGDRILDFWQAQDRARKLAGERRTGSVGHTGKPATVAQALDDYADNLAARGGNERDAKRLHDVLPAAILDKPVALLSARDLERWKNEFLASGRKAATVLRSCKSLAAALTLAAKLDPRITNRDAWRNGLSGINATHNPQNDNVLTDTQVWGLVDACYEIDAALGLYIEVHATTGARTSQIARLLVGDLQADRARLMMPSSRKGKGRQFGPRTAKGIDAVLATKLRQAAGDRSASAPLLLKADGSPWCPRNADHRLAFQAAVKRAGLVETTTPYDLRHSSITDMILKGVPLRVIAATHDTSVGQIEKTYSANISDHSDAVERLGLRARPPLRVVA